MGKQHLSQFLKYGMLPKALPTPFQTREYGRLIMSRLHQLPGAFEANTDNYVKPYSEVGDHNLARPNGFHRCLGVVNPIRFFNLSYAISKYWGDIDRHLSQESFSTSKPVIDSGGERALKGAVDWGSRDELRAKTRTTGQYLLKADIEKFYPSIYTHSIPWALHSKSKAKNNTAVDNLLGNLLDDRVVSLQDRQTNGIPIGPDTSLVIAEIILTRIDKSLRTKIPMNGFRAIDDYEMSFTNKHDAEEALSCLRRELSKFELRLNEKKTYIKRSPIPIVKEWVNKLRRYEFRNKNSTSQLNDLLDYFSKAFSMSKNTESGGVIRYAIARAGSVDILDDNLEVYESLLLQCASSEAQSIEYVIPELYRLKENGYSLRKDKIQSTIEDIVDRYIAARGGSEVAWALWMGIALEVTLSRATMTAVSQTRDPVVPVLALHAEEEGLTPNSFDGSQWTHLMNSDELYGENWLVSYEANVQGWISYGQDHVASTDGFRFLKDNDIHFYDTDATPVTSDDSKTLQRVVGGYA